MSLFKRLGAVDGIISIKTHLKGAFGFIGFLDLAFLFMEENSTGQISTHGYIISSTPLQKLAISPANNDLVDL